MNHAFALVVVTLVALSCGGTIASPADGGPPDGSACHVTPTGDVGNCFYTVHIDGDPASCGVPDSGPAPVATCDVVCDPSVKSCGVAAGGDVRCDQCQ